jgi:hypothetical protein
MIKTLPPRLAEIGKIKIGGKGDLITTKTGAKMRLATKFDHFKITKLSRDKHDNLILDEKTMELLGEKPKSLKCSLVYDDIDLNFLSSFSYFHGRKCFCRGDGEKAIRLYKTGKKIEQKIKGKVTKVDEFEKREIKCTNGECEYLINSLCKPDGQLSVILSDASKVGGVHKFRTHGWNSVQNIQSSLMEISIKTGGILANIPMILEILPKYVEGHGNIITVNISFDGTENELMKAALAEKKRRKLYQIDIKKIETLAIESGITDDNDDPGDIEDEFYSPENKVTNSSKSLEIDDDTFTEPAIIKTEVEKPEKIDDDEKKDIGAIL